MTLDSTSHMTYLFMLVDKTGFADIVNTAEGAADVVFIRLACVVLEAQMIRYIMIWSPVPNTSNAVSS